MKTLGELRAEVDCIDQLIIEQLGRRKLLSLAIGRLKREGKHPIYDTVREESLKKAHASLAKTYNLDPLFIARLFRIILKHSKILQKRSKNHF